MSKYKVLIVFGINFLVAYSCCEKQKTKIDINNTIDNTSEYSSTSEKTIQIGVAAMLSPENALPVYEEITQYIGKKLGESTSMLFTKDYASMNDLVKTQKVTAAFVCSGPYVTEHDRWGMELIAAPSMYGNTFYYSYIIVNKDSKINSFEELEGRKFAFTDPESNTGKLVPTYELAMLGRTPDNFFSNYIFTGSHDKSIEAVATKLVNGASVDHLIWEYLNSTDSAFTSKTRVIAKLGPFCMPPFVVHPNCDEDVKQNIRKILLSMHNDPEGKKILDKIMIDKFVPIKDECYQSIREMNKWVKQNKK